MGTGLEPSDPQLRRLGVIAPVVHQEATSWRSRIGNANSHQRVRPQRLSSEHTGPGRSGSGRGVEQAFQRTRLGSSQRYQLLLGERASEDHGKVIERRRGTSARKRALSQLANDAVLKRELSPVQVEFDDHPQDPDSDSSRSSRQPGWKLRSLRPDTPVDRPPAYAFRNSGPSTSLRMMSTAL